MKMRTRLKRQATDRARRFVSINGVTFKRGQRLEFRAIHPEFGVLLSGWFIADSNNPVVRGFDG